MKILKNKTGAIAIALLLILSFALPFAQAQVTYPRIVKTYAYLAAEPDPVGVGQNIYLSFGIDKVPMTVSGAYGDRWTNLTVTVTKPDGTTTKLSGYTADDTGFAHDIYVPTSEGNYSFQLYFGGQTLTGANPPPGGTAASNLQFIGVYYEPSTSSVQNVQVTQEPISLLPFNTLPTSYWTRPINMMNSNWNTIGGNWFGDNTYVNAGTAYNATGQFDPYTTAPSTAHVLWTYSLAPGGLIGGEYGATANSNFYSTAQYECKWKPVIMDGVMYYTLTPGASSYYEGTIAIDIRTGQTLWTKTPTQMNGTLVMGWIYNYISPNQYGGESYLWTTSTVSGVTYYSLMDATTGNFILQIQGVPAGVEWLNTVPDGALMGYYVNTTNAAKPMLTCWNASACILAGSSGSNPAFSANGWYWRPGAPTTINWTVGIMWAAPIATNVSGVTIPGTLSFSGGQAAGNWGIGGNTILLGFQSTVGGSWENWQIEAGYSIIDGSQLFIVNRTEPEMERCLTHEIGNGMYATMQAEDQTYTAYSDTTGQQLWVASFPTNSFWGYISTYYPCSAYGMLYTSTFDGHCYAWNTTNGKLVWDFYAGSAGYNTVYGTWPNKVIELVADGKVFLNGGHTYNPPLFRGSQAWCLNATTGDVIWNANSFCHSNNPTAAAADGEVFLPNSYDNSIYAYGMGASKTTVSAPQSGVTTVAPITITGSVTDLSPGAKQNAVAMNFPNGLPCVSDASESQFMEAVYQQQPMPTNITGVPMQISVVDANNNYRVIGTTTTDSMGNYGFSWTPDIPGKFQVFASFPGSGSNYPSSASTYFTANIPPATSPTATTVVAGYATTTDLMMYLAVGVIAIIIAIGIVGVLMLRKHP